MAAKPTQDPKWVTTDDPQHIIEPTAALKLNGVASGGIWGREHLNWMFNALSKWIDWVRSQALDKDNNLSDLSDTSAAFNNIKVSATTTSTGVIEKATAAETVAGTADKFPDAKEIKTERDKLLVKSNNLSDVVSASTAFDNIKQSATETLSGVVEKATDTETEAGSSGKFPDAASIASKFLKKSDNLNSVSNKTSAFNNIKQAATTTTTGVVEKATPAEVAADTVDKFPDCADIGSVYLKRNDSLTLAERNEVRATLGIYTGVVNSSGTGSLPTGWTVERLGIGRYEIYHNTSKYYTVACDPNGGDEQYLKSFATEDEGLQNFVVRSFSSNGTAQDVSFTFLAVSRN